MKTGLESLDTGAPEITYSGNEGPKSPQQMQQMQQMQMAQLEEEYDAYVDDMMEQGIEPMSMRQFLEQIAAEAQMSSKEQGIGSMAGGENDRVRELLLLEETQGLSEEEKEELRQLIKTISAQMPQGVMDEGIGSMMQDPREMAAFGGIMGVDGRRQYGGGSDAGKDGGYGYQGGSSNTEGVAGTGPASEGYGGSNDPSGDDKEGDTPTPTGPNQPDPEDATPDRSKITPIQQYNHDVVQGNIDPSKVDPPELTQRDLDFIANEKRRRLEEQRRRLALINQGGGGGGQNPYYGDDEDDDEDDDNNAFPDIPTNFVDLSGTQSYTNPAFGGQYFYGTPTITLANGGRANFAGGGIANLRQGYFLGKLVKSITKPFKKAFKGFKKIAKSPMGKMALLALGGYYMGGGSLFGMQRAGMSGFKMANLPGASFFNQPSTKILSNNAIKSPIAEAGPGIFKEAAKTAADPSGNFLTKSLGFMKDNPLATIMATSGLSGAYTAYLNNKREDETMADYQRRLEEERGNFAPIPTNFVQFADGGIADDDDDDESFRQKALGALYQKLAMGGSAGLPPVTMQTEGQDTQSFGDDESTGMANATPTMPNQMPMRPPMMDPRMQQQMMMQQRMNPMMNRGMMSMQQPPRIMAQEGGMMDMGGMEKDYRNEGGFVPIGEYERKDDVPARLSKNEFVFTADAVRNAGGGDIDRGAEIMENMMENLEQGGKVSKASQGLSGAREMFATSQRLEEVL